MRDFNRLKNRITIFTKDDGGYMPGGDEYTEYYSCYANVDNVWLKDLEIAKTNNTLNDVTVTIREPGRTVDIDNTMYFTVDNDDTKKFNIKSVQPDFTDNRFAILIGEAVTT